MRPIKLTDLDKCICPHCNRAWVDHPGLKQTCEERGDLQKESDEFRSLSILLKDSTERLIVERDELRKEREELLALLSLSRSLIEQLRRENSQLRILVASAHNTPCIHCGLEDMSKCKNGFPGCAMADDIICGQDEALATMRKERDELRQTIDALSRNIKHGQNMVATLQQENSELLRRTQ